MAFTEMLFAVVLGAMALLVFLLRSRKDVRKQTDAEPCAPSDEELLSALQEHEVEKAQKRKGKTKRGSSNRAEKEAAERDTAEKEAAEKEAAEKAAAEAVAAERAAAKREAQKLQAKKQAAQRKARETQQQIAVERARKKKEREASDAATAIVEEILSAFEEFVDSRAKQREEAFDMASSLVQEILDQVVGPPGECHEEGKPTGDELRASEMKLFLPNVRYAEDRKNASELTPLERDVLKYEKKLREVCKLQERREAGEVLDPKQLEKLARALSIIRKLEQLREACAQEAEDQAACAEEEAADDAHRGLDDYQDTNGEEEEHARFRHAEPFRLLTRQTGAPGLSRDSASASIGVEAPIIDVQDEEGLRKAPQQVERLEAPHPGDAATEPSVAAAPIIAPRILLRPRRPDETVEESKIAEPMMSLEQKQREYAAARARIFKEPPGRGRGGRGRGTGGRAGKTSARTTKSQQGRRRQGSTGGEAVRSHDKSDPDYDRNGVRLLAPIRASPSPSDSGTLSEGETSSDTASSDSDVIKPYW
eukprot:TRINITY_DN48587_c0_g1_i1.p1 TRINITY_DN48587_c0_g1~~TRINITY_DN48587_c0_g1_i1.p1  ORF type:complete len:537 (-),score=145.73 TRINITY_DN48587_c0_g1_i1:106-1716(-)